MLLRKTTNSLDMQNSKISMSIVTLTVVIVIFIATIPVFSLFNVTSIEFLDAKYIVFAQTEEQVNQEQEYTISQPVNKITIKLNSVNFAPLTNSDSNQLKVLIDYHVNDVSVINTPMTGVMKVYLSDGTLVKASSIPNGYIVGQSGTIQFATSFTDKTVQNVNADIALTNPLKTDHISNTIKTNASLSSS